MMRSLSDDLPQRLDSLEFEKRLNQAMLKHQHRLKKRWGSLSRLPQRERQFYSDGTWEPSRGD